MVISADINPKGVGAYERNRILSKKKKKGLPVSAAWQRVKPPAYPKHSQNVASVSKEAKKVEAVTLQSLFLDLQKTNKEKKNQL